MRSITSALLALLLASCGCGAAMPSLAPQVRRLEEATVALTDPLGEPFCAGVFVAPRLVATAAHCVLDDDGEVGEINVGVRQDMTTRERHDAWDRTFRGTLAFVSESQDVAIVRVAPGALRGLPVRLGGITAAGDRVLALGHPFGLCYTPTDGLVARNHVGALSPNQRWLQASALASPGNSGGPVVDMSGRLVGLVSFGVYGRAHLVGLVPAETVRRALVRARR